MVVAMATTRPTKRTSRRQNGGYAPEETRRALIASALELFGSKGYEATSVQEITDGAGVTKGAFYHHFESKEDLLRLIHDEFVDEQLAAVQAVLAEHEDPVRQLEELFRFFAESVRRFQPNVTVFFQERRYLTGDRFAAVKKKRDEFDRLFRGVITNGVEQGAFRDDLDPQVVYLGIIGMFSWMHQWYRPRGRLSTEEIADTFSRWLLDGLRAR